MRPSALLSLVMLAACGDAALVRPLVPEPTAATAIAPSVPIFTRRPFAGSIPLLNWFDHKTPQQGSNTDKTLTTTWAEVVSTSNIGIDGHSGYDWAVPSGAQVTAVASGTVQFAGIDPPFFCQVLGQTVTGQRRVIVRHTLPTGTTVESHYVHLSSTLVGAGQTVTSGALLGLSGNTGCSQQPHLHFEVRKVMPHGGAIQIDPYGWTVAAVDPWAVHAQGTESINLWTSTAAPARFREVRLPPNPGTSQALVTITAVQWMGVNDAASPNNEFIELTLDTRFGSSASLNGFQVRGDRSGFTYNLPSGLTLTTAAPTVRIHSGIGTNTATTLFMGRTSPMWSNNFDDCARRVNTNTNPPLQYVMNLGAAPASCQP